jgi:D-hexose-6-phosphate mutarotase
MYMQSLLHTKFNVSAVNGLELHTLKEERIYNLSKMKVTGNARFIMHVCFKPIFR